MVYTLLIAARFQTERLYLNFGDDHHRFLGFQMVGDVIFKYAAWLDATKFAAAGADVYLYHFDLDGRGDVFINGSSCCGLGHAKELTYTYVFFRFESMNCPNKHLRENKNANAITS